MSTERKTRSEFWRSTAAIYTPQKKSTPEKTLSECRRVSHSDQKRDGRCNCLGFLARSCPSDRKSLPQERKKKLTASLRESEWVRQFLFQCVNLCSVDVYTVVRARSSPNNCKADKVFIRNRSKWDGTKKAPAYIRFFFSRFFFNRFYLVRGSSTVRITRREKEDCCVRLKFPSRHKIDYYYRFIFSCASFFTPKSIRRWTWTCALIHSRIVVCTVSIDYCWNDVIKKLDIKDGGILFREGNVGDFFNYSVVLISAKRHHAGTRKMKGICINMWSLPPDSVAWRCVSTLLQCPARK